MVPSEECEMLLMRKDISANQYRGDISANRAKDMTLVQKNLPIFAL